MLTVRVSHPLIDDVENGEVPVDATLIFTPLNVTSSSDNISIECVFWNFNSSSWSTTNETTFDNGTHYICNVSHFTSFSVLVDVTGSITVS